MCIVRILYASVSIWNHEKANLGVCASALCLALIYAATRPSRRLPQGSGAHAARVGALRVWEHYACGSTAPSVDSMLLSMSTSERYFYVFDGMYASTSLGAQWIIACMA